MNLHSNSVTTLALLVSIVAGCSAGTTSSTPPNIEVRDSSGVQIVINSGPGRPLEIREVLRVGVLEGDPNLQLDRVRTVSVDSMGALWVVDSHASVRKFGPDGTYLGSIGGEGEGPGEARQYQGAWLGDHVVLVFAIPSTLQLFSSDGTFLGQRASRQPDGATSHIPMGVVGEEWMFRSDRFFDCQTGEYRKLVDILIGGVPSADVRTIGTFEGEITIADEPCVQTQRRASALLGNPAFASDPTGRLHRSDPVEYRVESYSLDGELQRVLRRDVATTPLGPEVREQVEEGLIADLRVRLAGRGESALQAEVEQAMETAWPSALPAYMPFIEGDRMGGLMAGPSGSLWVRRADLLPRPGIRAAQHYMGTIAWAWPPEWRAPAIFDLFDPNGVYTGSVELPSEFTPMAVTENRIYGTILDELDVQYVVAYEIVVGG